MDVGRLLQEPKLRIRKKAPIAAVFCVLAGSAGLALALHAAAPTSVTDRMSTLERLAQPGWWPTKMLASDKDYVGSEACAKCHAAISASFKKAEMSKALLRAADSEVLRTHEGNTFDLESYTYKLENTPQGPQFSVSQGSESAKMPITWAFGDGTVGQVYLTDVKGTFYESHFSYYGGTKGFDRTTNQPHRAETPNSAVGRSLMPNEARKCFVCHSAGVTAEGPLDNVMPGVTCEACHGPGADHVAAMKSGIEGGEALSLNPKRLDRVSQVDFCGACHMNWVDVQLEDVGDGSTVRFPAYRLMNSRCWEKGDGRITCTGCHDPHQPVVHEAAFYDQKCLGCHVTKDSVGTTANHPGKACPQSDRNCVSCHMPKRVYPDTHHAFTDHNIRIVRAGERLLD